MKAQNLLGLLYGIVAGIDDLNVSPKFQRGRLGRGCLFELIIVVFCNQGNQNLEFVHGGAPFNEGSHRTFLRSLTHSGRYAPNYFGHRSE